MHESYISKQWVCSIELCLPCKNVIRNSDSVFWKKTSTTQDYDKMYRKISYIRRTFVNN